MLQKQTIESKINTWLKHKWAMSMYIKNVPSFFDVTEFFKKQWTAFLSDQSIVTMLRTVAETYLREHPNLKENINEDVLYYVEDALLLDVKTTENTIVVFSHLCPDEILYSVTADIAPLEVEEEKHQGVSAVHCSAEEGNAMEEAMKTLIPLMCANTRLHLYQAATKSYQKDHPICPVCGCPVQVEERSYNDDPKWYFCCQSCEWESKACRNTKWDLLDDFEKIYPKEISRVIRENHAKEVIEKNITEILQDLQTVKSAIKSLDKDDKKRVIQSLEKAYIEIFKTI